MKSRRLFSSAAAILALGLAAGAQAQLDGWRLNEVVTRTNDSTSADRSQFVELYHPVADQSVDGLSIILIRPLFGSGEPDAGPFRFSYRVDLTGTASGNFFLVGNQNYATNFGDQDFIANPADSHFMRPGGATQGQYQEVALVETADIDGSWTVSTGTSGYQFDGTEFNNGADIIDIVYLVGSASPGDAQEDGRFVTMDPADPQEYIENPDFATAAPIGGNRVVDGTGDWVAYTSDLHIDPDGPATQQLPSAATPGASNTWTTVSDWTVFR